MKRKVTLLIGTCLLSIMVAGTAAAGELEQEPDSDLVEIIGESTTTYSDQDTITIDGLEIKLDSVELYDAEDDRYRELYIYISAKNTGYADVPLRQTLSATMNYMSRYDFTLDIDRFEYPTKRGETESDYLLDPLSEMLVVLHTQVPKAISERGGEVILEISSNGDVADMVMDAADMGESLGTYYPVTFYYDNTVGMFGHRYDLFEAEDFDISTWEEAEAFCESMGGHLATITSQLEDTVMAVFREEFWLKPNTAAFLGASDTEEEGVFKWVTGEEFSYTNWESGEPNNEGSQGQSYLCYYYRSSDGTWDDDNFDMDEAFICEWDCMN